MKIEIQNEEIINIISGGTLSRAEIKSVARQVINRNDVLKKENEVLRKQIEALKQEREGENDPLSEDLTK